MAAATSVTQYMTVQGPIKVEYISATFASSADTVASTMQRPIMALAVTNADGGGAATAISGKTITVTDSGISASVVNLIVVGF